MTRRQPLPEPEVAEANLEAARRAHHAARKLAADTGSGVWEDFRSEKYGVVLELLKVRTASFRAAHETIVNDSLRRWE